MKRDCPICLGEFHTKPDRRSYCARTCRHDLAAPGPDCWFTRGGLQALIAESLASQRPPTKESAARRETVLRGFQGAASVNEAVARQYLTRITPNDRGVLLKYAVPGLRDWLLGIFKADDLIATQELRPVQYPDLPTDLLEPLKAWEAKNRARLNSRITNGYSRSPKALQRIMSEPISLAIFLSERGVGRWDIMTMHDRVAFAKTRPKRVQEKLRPFIAFLEGGNPFKTRRGRPPKKARKVIKETRQTPMLPPDVLKGRLKAARERLSDDQYLLYWLVAKLGLTAKAACGLTLDRVTINSQGRLVIRPADAWFALPKSVAPAMEALARAADPAWPYADPAAASPIPVTDSVVSQWRRHEFFQSEARLLRSSAIYAAMHAGQLDRKSLMAITGVSHKTITNLEYLIPADIHSLGSHELIAARNTAILGEDDG